METAPIIRIRGFMENSFQFSIEAPTNFKERGKRSREAQLREALGCQVKRATEIGIDGKYESPHRLRVVYIVLLQNAKVAKAPNSTLGLIIL